MDLQPRDRQIQADFCEIRDAIDVLSSIALNARQPLPPTAAKTAAPPAPVSPEKQSAQNAPPLGTQSAILSEEAAASREPQEVNAAASAEAAAETPEDSVKLGSGAGGAKVEGAPDGPSDAPEVQRPPPPTSQEAAVCEVATLRQILLANDSRRMALVSDVDEQLLLNVSFKQPIRVYCNKGSLNFCGVTDEACAFSVMLSDDDVLQERRIALPGSKFHMCSSVQFLVQENLAGSAHTFINKLALFGVAHKRYS